MICLFNTFHKNTACVGLSARCDDFWGHYSLVLTFDFICFEFAYLFLSADQGLAVLCCVKSRAFMSSFVPLLD